MSSNNGHAPQEGLATPASIHAGMVTMSGDFIVGIMGLPEGTQILGIVRSQNDPNLFGFILSNPDMPLTLDDGSVMQINATVEIVDKRIVTGWNFKPAEDIHAATTEPAD